MMVQLRTFAMAGIDRCVQMGPIPEDDMRLKVKILRNLAVAQFRLHDYEAALGSFETIMAAEPSARDGFSVVLCHCRLRHDPHQLQNAFTNLVHVELEVGIALLSSLSIPSSSLFLAFHLQT